MENVLLYTEQKWKQLTSFSKKEDLKARLWNEIVDYYAEPYRFYHTLAHVAALFQWSEKYLPNLQNPAVVGFSILYHDIVYDTFKTNNEEESAGKAREHLQKLQVKASVIDSIEEFILATKMHSVPTESALQKDLSFFLDFDLAILGSGWDDYEEYSHLIRKEYRQYPDAVYNPGRKYALQKLSDKEPLYLTSDVQVLLEEPARNNLFREMQLLS